MARINVDQVALGPDGRRLDLPAIRITSSGEGALSAHEVAIICPCCAHPVAIVTQPPNVGAVVWIETDAALTAFARSKRNDRTSYEEVGTRGRMNPKVSPEAQS